MRHSVFGYSDAMKRKPLIAAGVATLLMLGLSGCSSLSYYSQSVIGHSRLMLAREPVPKVMSTADPELQKQLAASLEIRAFAVKELGLPDNNSYSTYVDLEREFPVWNVIAAPEFSVHAQQWCYPVIGCAAYRGYFKRASAIKYAERLQHSGLETVVLGATAYSTLGWFSDPILPSMLRYGEADFAETLFHELAHQQLYINGDSEFNEAFATVVGEVGADRWLKQNRPELLDDYQTRRSALTQFYALIADSKTRLNDLFNQGIDGDEMRVRKQAEFDDLKQRYEQLKSRHWQGRGWFDRWFDTPLNNARLAAFSTYRDRVPELQAFLALCGGKLSQFYRALSVAEVKEGRVVLPDNCR